MRARRITGFLFIVLLLTGLCSVLFGANSSMDTGDQVLRKPTGCTPNTVLRTHDVGNMCLTISNYGFFGSGRPDIDTPINPETGEMYVSCEVPCGSNIEYLFQGALWIGAIVDGETLVSVGQDGWERNWNQLYPSCIGQPFSEIEERSTETGDPCAVSQQDFIAYYTDTLMDPTWVPTGHRPIGIAVTQKSYAWSYDYAKNFVFFDYWFKNIRKDGKTLEDVYIGLYIDADVGHIDTDEFAQDDITGFIRYYVDYSVVPPETTEINVAWIADNDGDPEGGRFTYMSPTGVTGVRVLRSPNPELQYSYNWWISNINEDYDWGPDHYPFEPVDGTPSGSKNKYIYMSNGEFDYDQYLIGDYMDSTGWLAPPDNWDNLRDGYDTRFLLSFGPLTIPPGDSVPVTIAYIAGENFHTDPSNDPSDRNWWRNFNFESLAYAARWAALVYDNPNTDSPFDENGDCEIALIDSFWSDYFGRYVYRYEGMDGFGGEDVGTDGLGPWNEGYPGPDPDGTENNGKLDPGEDTFGDPGRFGYGNGKLDLGDGVPDYKGPVPPPSPDFTFETINNSVKLIWTSEPENFVDPLTGLSDFEGYRIYMADKNLEPYYTLVASFDKVDFFQMDTLTGLLRDTLADEPGTDVAHIGAIDSVYVRQPVDYNVGMPTPDSIVVNERGDTIRYYSYTVSNLRTGKEVYFTITSFDYGQPSKKLGSLESSKTYSAKGVVVRGAAETSDKVYVVPNPYKISENYGSKEGLWWEGDPTRVWSEYQRRIRFYNLPDKCTIRIYTLDGDLVKEMEHDESVYGTMRGAHDWDMISANDQMVASGIYLFSIEDEDGSVQVGKFVIIK
ncbi:hypothetical protein J7K18_06410 [bacterium]|nr:hypothetical protein [bacterium]